MLLALFIAFVALFIVLPLVGLAIWTLISTAIVGLVLGGLGRLLVPGTQRISIVATILLGLVGSIAGGFIGQHVLAIGRVLTVLLEIGVSAVLVGSYAGLLSRGAIGGKRQAQIGRGR